MIGIYKITNIINSKCYIGKSEVSVENRLECHRKGVHSNIYLQSSIKHYGVENFRFEVLEECEKEDCNSRERYWIEYYNCIYPNGYNGTSGGEGESGYHLSDETKRKLSNSQIGDKNSMYGKPHVRGKDHGMYRKGYLVSGNKNGMYNKHHTEESKRAISEGVSKSLKGRNLSDETKRKISEKAKGRVVSDETRLKLSKHNKGKILSDETKNKLSKSMKGNHNFDNKGRKWINNEEEMKFVKQSELDDYLSNGWRLGKLKK